MKREIKVTSDGSRTIYIPEMDENYHSGHGALQEAVHVFLKNGLETLELDDISIFEMGFGTGLNAYLSMIFAFETHKQVKYVGIEAFPVEGELIQALGYTDLLKGNLAHEFHEMHQTDWGRGVQLTSEFHFTKLKQRIEEYIPDLNTIDIVFYDAFGPRAQKEMWEKEILEKMYQVLKPEGILVTYCAMGQFRRDLISIGFEVERLPGPPGKREMIRAVKS